MEYSSYWLLHEKGKGKVYLGTGHEGPEGEWRYGSPHSLTSELDGVVVSAMPRPLYPWGTDPVHIVQEAGWAAGLFWVGATNFALTRI